MVCYNTVTLSVWAFVNQSTVSGAEHTTARRAGLSEKWKTGLRVPVLRLELEEAQRTGAIADQQVFGLLVVVQDHLVGFAADPGLLVTAKGSMGRVQMVTVGPYPSGLNGTTHAVGTVDVAGPEAGTKTVLGVVGNGQSLGFVLEGGHCHHRTEDFLLEDAHLVVALEQCRLHIVAAGQIALQLLHVATSNQLGAIFFSHIHV